MANNNDSPKAQPKWKSLLVFGSKPDSNSFPDLPDYITWARLAIGLIYGTLVLGTMGTNQAVPGKMRLNLVFGITLITFLPIVYCETFLHADTDSYQNIKFVAVPNGVALMVLVWILLYTMEHSEEEAKLAAAVITKVVESLVLEGGTEGEAIGIEDTEPESEF